MAEQNKTETGITPAPAASGRAPASPGRGRGPAGGGMMGGHGLIGSGAKSKNFRQSGKRLVGLLKPHMVMIVIVVLLAIGSVTLATVGPKILGQATNKLFSGLMSETVTK